VRKAVTFQIRSAGFFMRNLGRVKMAVESREELQPRKVVYLQSAFLPGEMFGPSARTTSGFQRRVDQMVSCLQRVSKLSCSSPLTVIAVSGLARASRPRRARIRRSERRMRRWRPRRQGARFAAGILGLLRKPKPLEGGYSLKVRFPYGANSHEHIWMAR